ncbi:MAG: hypothetical protein ACI9HK_000743, partial [Pirellulaceae bacterium]
QNMDSSRNSEGDFHYIDATLEESLGNIDQPFAAIGSNDGHDTATNDAIELRLFILHIL